MKIDLSVTRNPAIAGFFVGPSTTLRHRPSLTLGKCARATSLNQNQNEKQNQNENECRTPYNPTILLSYNPRNQKQTLYRDISQIAWRRNCRAAKDDVERFAVFR